MRNIELKARLANLDTARRVAESIATKRLGTQHQIDTYFHCLHGRLKLRQIDSLRAELISYARADEEGPKPSDYRLVPIAHPETLKAALTAALGVRAVVEKRREIFLHHNVRIHLDHVVHLGRFIEFEAVLDSASDEAAARALLDSLMRQFALAPPDLLRGSYGEMVE
jgi:adenylate cyclase, class 2